MIREGRNVVSAALLGILCGGALAQAAQPAQKEPDQRAFDQIGEQVYQEKAAPGLPFLCGPTAM
jgi:hypothetical protein